MPITIDISERSAHRDPAFRDDEALRLIADMLTEAIRLCFTWEKEKRTAVNLMTVGT